MTGPEFDAALARIAANIRVVEALLAAQKLIDELRRELALKRWECEVLDETLAWFEKERAAK